MNELISSALSGDSSGLDALIEAIWPRCYRLAAAVIGDRALAQDAAQESCAVIYAKIQTLRNPAAFDAWLYRIVMREAARVRRRLASSTQLYDDGAFERDETIDVDIWHALSQLPADQRDVVVLFYFYDLPTAEIADILRVAHSTVRTRLSRGRERLRGLLGDYVSDVAVSQEIKHYAV